ncbi:MAG: hypothetical protein KQH83_05405 [Actinobacteria bacterium]|nr:hypothetical protein [Actinomycetota bacterium]
MVWAVGSGAQTTGGTEEPDLGPATSLTPPDPAVLEGETIGLSEPSPIPEGPLTLRDGLNRVRGVAAAPDGSLWAATDGGVIRWNPDTGAFHTFVSGEELPDTGVAGVVIGSNGTVWIGSPGWIARWDGAWTRYAAPSGFDHPLAVEDGGVVWWGSGDGGVIGSFDGARWEVFHDVVPMGSESMAIAPDGTVWAATASTDDTHDGVVAYDGSGWVVHAAAEGLPGPIGGSVTVTPDGTLWVGSMGGAADRRPGGGIARFDGSGWTVYTADDGLVSDNAAVASGRDGTVWAVALEGLARFDGSQWESFPGTAGFGFGAVVDPSGVLWAPAADPGGGIKGFDGTATRRWVMQAVETADGDPGDAGAAREVRSDPPDDARLDFLATVCDPVSEDSSCRREGHFLDPEDASRGTTAWLAGLPFHIRQGFVHRGDEPLGAGYDLAVSVTRLVGPEPDDGTFELGTTYRFHTDYVVDGMAVKCGPAYWEQTDPQPCEWFVHDFPDGLPPGRYEIWVEWEAPCSAWLDLGLAAVCDDPDEVSALFASSVNMPFYGPGYRDDAAEGLEEQVYPDEVTKGAGL